MVTFNGPAARSTPTSPSSFPNTNSPSAGPVAYHPFRSEAMSMENRYFTSLLSIRS